MDRDWARLSRYIASAREALGLPQPAFAAELGVGRSAIQKLESGHEYRKVTPLHRAVERRFGWAEGSIETVLAGGEAERFAGPVSDSPIEAGVDALLDDLTARVKGALLGGQVVDATAVPMGDGDGSVVIIWKGGEERDLTPAQRRRLERQWSKFQRAAHDILADGEEQEE
ncbi:helix-turn-helix domain-containing protein [Kitasatospora sp. CB02891]|uniref:helix-turn-helix domain-containing protein n=1 Tax=Kitasatospora sp. CB02891 TaxID=2020329 RepID=UPI0012FD0D3D|nr:helix-turn-helix transcriptional regulator [Kitasatospora sp. CB02891]